MELHDAIEIVMELAKESVLDEDMVMDCPDLEMERDEQKEAINTVHDFFVNNVFDGTE